MRKSVLLSTILFTTPFTMNMSYGQCVNTLDCQALGYNQTSCKNAGVKCPTGNYWYCPKDNIETCTPLPDEMFCQYGTTTGDDGCGGTRTVCKECVPLPDDWWCPNGTTTASDGCGGTRTVCKDEPVCNSSSSDWCPVHLTCHENCCKNGKIEACDPQCGGSGCSSGGGDGGDGENCYTYTDSRKEYGYGCYCEDFDTGTKVKALRKLRYRLVFYDRYGAETYSSMKEEWFGIVETMEECEQGLDSTKCICDGCSSASSTTVCE